MSEQSFHDSLWLLTRARGVGLALRLLVFACPAVALVCVRVAGGNTPGVVQLLVMGFTAWCAVVPDSHGGIVVVTLLGLVWITGVDDATSPWSLVVALALLVFHLSASAASVAAPGAVWSPAMRRRWGRRTGALAAACLAVWLLVEAVNLFDLAASSSLVAAALVVLAVGGLAASDVTIGRRDGRHG